MQVRVTKRALSGAVAAAALLLAGPAQAALEDRDLDGNGITDAFYDTDLDITWLRDANVNGQMDWATAVNWAEGFSLGKYSNWRLPTSDACDQFNCTGSEMGHLWYVELGNTAGLADPKSTGDFQNMQSWSYWSGTEYAPQPQYVHYFSTIAGMQNVADKSVPYYAMAVTNGDVGMVPEPETYALMMAGLAGVAIARRTRRV